MPLILKFLSCLGIIFHLSAMLGFFYLKYTLFCEIALSLLFFYLNECLSDSKMRVVLSSFLKSILFFALILGFSENFPSEILNTNNNLSYFVFIFTVICTLVSFYYALKSIFLFFQYFKFD